MDKMENNTGVFVTSSDLPLDPLYLAAGGVVELDTGLTASKVQVWRTQLIFQYGLCYDDLGDPQHDAK